MAEGPTDDLFDVLTEGRRLYKVPDMTGQIHEFPIPNDLPFPKTLAFMRAFDALQGVQKRLTTTKDQKGVLDLYEEVYSKAVEALLPLLQIGSPDLTLEDLSESFGQGTLTRLIAAIVERMQGPKENRAQRRATKPSPGQKKPARTSSA